MYHQIALNRRKSALIAGAFILVWLGLGYPGGLPAAGPATAWAEPRSGSSRCW
jgi:hypothetical protein